MAYLEGGHTMVMAKSIVWLVFVGCCFGYVHQFRHLGSHHVDGIAKANIPWWWQRAYFSWFFSNTALAMFTNSATLVPTTWMA
jgi:hypothetical protein